MSDYIVLHGIRVAKDFVPETFGRLTAIGPAFITKVGKKQQPHSFQVLVCDCGEVVCARVSDLRNGHTTNCGCRRKKTLSRVRKTHGLSSSGMYYIWANMVDRCSNPQSKGYSAYGGRGIQVCDRWRTVPEGLQNFLADMGPRPSDKHSIDRIDVNGDYCPENCRWATAKEQMRNTRRNRWLEYDGKRMILGDWAMLLGIDRKTITNRIKKGWPLWRVLSGGQKKARKNNV